MHGLKVQSTDTSHKSFLQVLLHHLFVSMFILNNGVCFIQFVSQGFYFFIVLSTDMLKFKFHSLFKIFSVFHNFPCSILLLPALKYFACQILLVLAGSVF
jgi:hypothetical protein